MHVNPSRMDRNPLRYYWHR